MSSIRRLSISLIPVAVAGGLASCGSADVGGLSSEPAADPPGSIRVDDVLFVPLTSDWKTVVSAKPIAEQTVDELAESMRPIRAEASESGTKMYRAAEPAYDVARAIKANQLMGNVVNNEGARSSQLLGPPGSSGEAQDVSPQWFFDINNAGHPIVADNSSADGQTTFPFDAVVYIKGNTGNCTGTYVAAHTMITAAHCIEANGVQNSGFQFTPGARGSGGNVTSAPFGSYPPASGSWCYGWTIPHAWGANNCPDGVGEGVCESFDWGSFDFRSCGNPTIRNWMGIVVNENSFPSVRLDGYPGPYTFSGSPPNPVQGTQFPGCGTNTNPTSAYPFLCGSSGPAEIHATSYVESSSNVESPGFSGGPWWLNFNGSDDVSAISTGYIGYSDFGQCGFNTCYRNYARLIDTAVWNFFTTYTEL